MTETTLQTITQALARISADLHDAKNSFDLRSIFDIRSPAYSPLIDLAKTGDAAAIRLLDMMQASWIASVQPNAEYKHRFDFMKRDCEHIFGEKGLVAELTKLETLQHGKEAPMLNGGVVGTLVKSIEITLKQISKEEAPGLDAREIKSKITSPILIAGLGSKAIEEFNAGHIQEGLYAATQASLVTATQLQLLKPALKALQNTATGQAIDLASEKVSKFIGLQKTLTIAGRDIPIIGLIISETGTLIGVTGRLLNGDFKGAAGTLVTGTAGNLTAELIPIPGLDLVGGETVEELMSMGMNASLNPDIKVKGSTVLSAAKKLWNVVGVTVYIPPRLDASGRAIEQQESMAMRYHQDNTTSVAPFVVPELKDPKTGEIISSSKITYKEQRYLTSVEEKLRADPRFKDDPEVDRIIHDLRKVFTESKGDDMFLEGEYLDKRLESRGINTKTWTRY